MADETNRDDLLRGTFKKLRERVRERLRSTRAAAPVDADKDRGMGQEEVVRESPQREELTQERMDAMKSRTYAERARLTVTAYEKQRWDDIKFSALRHGYQTRKAEAADANRIEAFLGEAKEIPPSQIDNRPGEKLALRRTKGMARKRDLGDGSGPSP
jgi:hypothetical protein